MSSSYVRKVVEDRATRIARKLGVSPEDLIRSIESYTAEITILGDRTGTTKATACAGDDTQPGDGTSGDHVNLEPKETQVEYVCLGMFNQNSAAETETWGRGDFYHGDEKVPMSQHASGSTFSQRRCNALAWSLNSADCGADSFPYMHLPAGTKDLGLKMCLFNIAAASAEQTASILCYYIPLKAGTWKPDQPGKPCACTSTASALR